MTDWIMFLDDERHPPEDGQDWVICRSHAAAVAEILYRKQLPKFVSFDHDIGPGPDGLKVAHHLCDLDAFSDHFEFPQGFDWFAHSQNPVGRDNINGYLTGYFEWKRGGGSRL